MKNLIFCMFVLFLWSCDKGIDLTTNISDSDIAAVRADAIQSWDTTIVSRNRSCSITWAQSCSEAVFGSYNDTLVVYFSACTTTPQILAYSPSETEHTVIPKLGGIVYREVVTVQGFDFMFNYLVPSMANVGSHKVTLFRDGCAYFVLYIVIEDC